MTKILTPTQAAEYTGYSRETLADWCSQSRGRLRFGMPIKGPAWVDTPHGKCRGYTQAALDEWMAASEVAA